VPQPGRLEALVRVKAAGICHSDAHYRSGVTKTGPLPVTFGTRSRASSRSWAGGHSSRARRPRRRALPRGVRRLPSLPVRPGAVLPDGPDDRQAPRRRVGRVHLHARAQSLRAARARAARARRGHDVLVVDDAARAEEGAARGRGDRGRLSASAASAPRPCSWLGDGGARRVRGRCQPGQAGTGGGLRGPPGERVAGRPGGRDPPAHRRARRRRGGRSGWAAGDGCGGRAVPGAEGPGGDRGAERPTFEIASYTELLGREAEVIGVADHLAQEMPLLLEFASRGALDLTRVITRRVPLEAAVIDGVLDELDRYGDHVRTVIVFD